MSDPTSRLTKKQQKAQRFRDKKAGKVPPAEEQEQERERDGGKKDKKEKRAEKFKGKGKGASAVPDGGDLPEADGVDEDGEDGAAGPASRQQDRSEKKAKASAKAHAKGADGKDDEATTEQDTASYSKPGKKRKRATTDSADAQKSAGSSTGAAVKTTFGEDGEVQVQEAVKDKEAGGAAEGDAKKRKFIVFVGNMPFDITADKLGAHFSPACGETPSVRLLTKKADSSASPSDHRGRNIKGKPSAPARPSSKGCAFVEFKSASSLQKALHFHHTLLGGRQINVELTAGGGGNTTGRKEKIRVKNETLDSERQKLHEKYIGPANDSHKALQAAKKAESGSDLIPRKKVRLDGEGEANWGARGGNGARGGESGKTQGGGAGGRAGRAGGSKMPRWMATGANATRLQD